MIILILTFTMCHCVTQELKEELEEMQRDIVSRKDGLEGINGTLRWSVYLFTSCFNGRF